MAAVPTKAAVPLMTDLCWRRLLTSPSCPEFTSLATKLTVGRLRQDVREEPAALAPAIREIVGFFNKNEFASRDLKLI